MGRKSVSDSERVVPIVVHTKQYKVDAIGKENLKEVLTAEIEKQYLKANKKTLE